MLALAWLGMAALYLGSLVELAGRHKAHAEKYNLAPAAPTLKSTSTHSGRKLSLFYFLSKFFRLLSASQPNSLSLSLLTKRF